MLLSKQFCVCRVRSWTYAANLGSELGEDELSMLFLCRHLEQTKRSFGNIKPACSRWHVPAGLHLPPPVAEGWLRIARGGRDSRDLQPFGKVSGLTYCRAVDFHQLVRDLSIISLWIRDSTTFRRSGILGVGYIGLLPIFREYIYIYVYIYIYTYICMLCTYNLVI